MRLSQTTVHCAALIAVAGLTISSANVVMAEQKPQIEVDAPEVQSFTEISTLVSTVPYTAVTLSPTQIPQTTAITLPPSQVPPSSAVTIPTTTIKSPSRFWAKRDQFTHGELMNLLEDAGFSGPSLKIAWGIAMRESQGIPTAHNRNARTGDNSYGLFQINMIGSLGPNRRKQYGLNSNDDLFNPVINAKVAYQLSGRGSSFGHWGFGPQSYKGNVAAPEVYRFLSRFSSNSRG